MTEGGANNPVPWQRRHGGGPRSNFATNFLARALIAADNAVARIGRPFANAGGSKTYHA